MTPPHLGDLDAYPVHSHLLAPWSELSHMFLLEVNRGCGRGCRFCAAGFIYRPLRGTALWTCGPRSSPESGRAKIGLVGTAVSDHPGLKDLFARNHRHRQVPGHSSIRADCADAELLPS